MNNYIKRDYKAGTEVEFKFIPSSTIPRDLPLSTPLTFAFAGQNLLLVKKRLNDWWDIMGGKIEKNESYIETLKREAIEEGGVEIDNIILIGYVLATNIGVCNSKFPPQTVLPVTISFIKKVIWDFVATDEIVSRDLVKRSEVQDFLKTRLDDGQLISMYGYIIDFLDVNNFKCEFEYKNDNLKLYNHLPVTQSCVFVMNNSGNFYIVRERGSQKYLLPGGGCHIYETGEMCAKREVYEELGIKIYSLILLGIIIVRILDQNSKVLSESLQHRYFTKTLFDMSMLRKNDDFEIEEIIELPLSCLEEKVEHLKNPNGPVLIKNIKSLI